MALWRKELWRVVTYHQLSSRQFGWAWNVYRHRCYSPCRRDGNSLKMHCIFFYKWINMQCWFLADLCLIGWWLKKIYFVALTVSMKTIVCKSGLVKSWNQTAIPLHYYWDIMYSNKIHVIIPQCIPLITDTIISPQGSDACLSNCSTFNIWYSLIHAVWSNSYHENLSGFLTGCSNCIWGRD